MNSNSNHRITTISNGLRSLEQYLPRNSNINIPIPPGVIRTVDELLNEYSFISDNKLRKNICYAVESLDFYKWLINRFNIYGPVSSYLFKTGIILVDMIVEAITRDFLKQKTINPSNKHSKNISKLSPMGVSEKMCVSIKILHSRRNNIHLHLVTDLEANKYTLRDWNHSILCLRAYREHIRELIKNKS
ncbi:MAG: hypothetical protein JW832_11040 [Deltaproteobacteria bacterium]|nr:hypothetical protein [Deltaproteobacteria bacterium]